MLMSVTSPGLLIARRCESRVRGGRPRDGHRFVQMEVGLRPVDM